MNRYKIDERGGIIAVVDTKHPAYANKGNGLHGDEEFVVCHWMGSFITPIGKTTNEWVVSENSKDKAKLLCNLLKFAQ